MHVIKWPVGRICCRLRACNTEQSRVHIDTKIWGATHPLPLPVITRCSGFCQESALPYIGLFRRLLGHSVHVRCFAAVLLAAIGVVISNECIFLFRNSYCCCSAGREQTGLPVAAGWCWPSMPRKQQQLWCSRCRAWPFGHHVLLASGLVFLWGFLAERVYSNDLRSLKDLKHNSEHAVGVIYQQTLRKSARSTVKVVIACLHEGWGHFQHML